MSVDMGDMGDMGRDVGTAGAERTDSGSGIQTVDKS